MQNAALARAFEDLNSPQHHQLLRDLPILGHAASIRYYLGRLLARNFFTESDDQVTRALVTVIADLTSAQGASLLLTEPLQGWMAVQDLLRHHYERKTTGKSTRNPKRIAALTALLTDPTLPVSTLAQQAQTTEKQLARMPDISLLRRLISLQSRQRLNKP